MEKIDGVWFQTINDYLAYSVEEVEEIDIIPVSIAPYGRKPRVAAPAKAAA
jgi:hypothetical protein